MIKNYFLTAIRNLRKQIGYSFINILGLSIGIACSIFIGIYVFHESNYDDFHTKGKDIYRVYVKGNIMGSPIDMPITASPMAKALKEEFPEILEATRFREYGNWLIKYKDKKFHEKNLMFADSNFFEVFDFQLLKGKKEKVLSRPKSVVLTEQAAHKYFGEEDPIGKVLRLESDTNFYEVTGIMQNTPSNSHIHFDMIGSLCTFKSSRNTQWLSHNFYTYVLLKPNTHLSLAKKINRLIPKYVGPQIQNLMGVTLEKFLEKGNTMGYYLQPLKDIHLNPFTQYEFEQQGSKNYIYIFSIIAIFILFIACVNFTNLATARSANRAKEVGLKKSLGAKKGTLIKQFLSESIILCFLSTILAVLWVELFLNAFRNLINIPISINYFSNPYIVPGLIALSLTVGILAGSYPAFILASYNPIKTLKGNLNQGAKSGKFRSILVVFQFTIAIFILLGTFAVHKQVKYMQNKNLGFKKEALLLIHRSDALKDKTQAFKEEAKKCPGVLSITHSNSLPGKIMSNNGYLVEGRPTSELNLFWELDVAPDFKETFELEMVKGRFFSKEISSDSFSMVINEAAVKHLQLKDPINKRLMHVAGNNSFTYYTIIGVIKDFHFQSLREKIKPMTLRFLKYNPEGFVTIKVKTESIQETIEQVEKIWNKFVVGYPMDYSFFEDDYNKLYKNEQKTERIFSSFSILAIIIACLGLFGLVSYTSIQRTREFGIRKAIGSSSKEILFLITKETLKLIFISGLIASSLAFFSIHKWLEDFAYRTEISFSLFAMVIGSITLISLLTVILQAIKASRLNPVAALKK